MAKLLQVSDWATLANTIDKFGRSVIKASRKELSEKKRRQTGSGRWITSNGNATGNLYKSLSFKRKNLSSEFSMAYYGYWKDQGRKPGKGVPVDALNAWIRIKPVRPRDEKGRFIARTPATMKSLSFLINRSIKEHGIKKTRFFSGPFELYYKKLDEEIRGAITKDLDLKFAE